MRIVKPLEETSGTNSRESIKALQDKLRAEYPIYASLLLGVNYDTKTDRYVAKLGYIGEKSSTVKVSDDVAAFMLANIELRGGWYLKLEKGCAVDVVLYSYD